eukprot:gene17150-biopygen7213
MATSHTTNIFLTGISDCAIAQTDCICLAGDTPRAHPRPRRADRRAAYYRNGRPSQTDPTVFFLEGTGSNRPVFFQGTLLPAGLGSPGGCSLSTGERRSGLLGWRAAARRRPPRAAWTSAPEGVEREGEAVRLLVPAAVLAEVDQPPVGVVDRGIRLGGSAASLPLFPVEKNWLDGAPADQDPHSFFSRGNTVFFRERRARPGSPQFFF